MITAAVKVIERKMGRLFPGPPLHARGGPGNPATWRLSERKFKKNRPELVESVLDTHRDKVYTFCDE